MALPLAATYHLSAAVFQFIVALALLLGRRSLVRIGLSGIIFLSGVETLHFYMLETGRTLLPGQPALEVVDIFIVTALPFLLLQFPRSAGRWTLYAYGAVLASWVPWMPYYLANRDYPAPAGADDALFMAYQIWPTFAATAVLAFWCLPQWLSARHGPSRTRATLVLMAVGTGLMLWPGEALFWRIVNPVADLRFLDRSTSNPPWYLAQFLARDIGYLLILAFVVVSLGVAVWRRRQLALPLAALFTAGVLIGFRLTWLGEENYAEFPSQVLRPGLIALAFIRTDALDYPTWLRHWGPQFVAWSALPLLLLVITVILSPAGMATDAVAAPTLLLAAIIVAVGLAAGRAASQPLSLADPTGRRQALDRYRLALEEETSESSLRSLRRRLGVSREQDLTLRAVLASNAVVPSSALVGLAKGDRVGNWRIERPLGEGGFGRALLAHDDAGRRAVIKEVLTPWGAAGPDAVAALGREVDITSHIECSAVAKAHGLIQQSGLTYLVREYIPGPTLQEAVVANGGALPAEKIRDVVRGLAVAIEALHEAGIHNLDLKPANVVLRGGLDPVIIDLGTARLEATQTRAATAVIGTASATQGSWAWMAPEAVQGHATSPRADWWSLGALIHFMQQGEPPVDLTGLTDHQARIQLGDWLPPRRAPDEPEDLAAIRVGCLKPAPSHRLWGATAITKHLA